jgi:hypothetical protein
MHARSQVGRRSLDSLRRALGEAGESLAGELKSDERAIRMFANGTVLIYVLSRYLARRSLASVLRTQGEPMINASYECAIR